MSALPTNNLLTKHNFEPMNTLIQHLTNEDGRLKKLNAFFIDEDGETADIPFEIDLGNMNDFIHLFEDAYVGFKDEDNKTLFEISEGLIVFVTMELPIKRGDVRSVMYKCGMKKISS